MSWQANWLSATALQPPSGGFVLERDSEVAREEPGTHNGGLIDEHRRGGPVTGPAGFAVGARITR